MADGLEEEGLFARDMPTVAPDLLTDILCVLAQQNDDAVRNPEDFLDHLAPTDTVELVFRSCSHLNLPLFVQFMAVEYLDSVETRKKVAEGSILNRLQNSTPGYFIRLRLTLSLEVNSTFSLPESPFCPGVNV
ncbi:hypothetical protein HPB47_003931 [Ixodes persulcatus]|uniref:Uncharacterized protein n=1 Tax=Ixodes persulcatus TaxID=34615 RepID=A0AC60PI78_IXOPE|nr:hypothetical protein HPB47_003931 [Ixodes persulcatus]